MPDAATPGQVCYETFCHGHGDPTWFTPWQELLYARQQIWEAAAQAVQDLVRRELMEGFAQARGERDAVRQAHQQEPTPSALPPSLAALE